jgi:hypothetical protein
MTGKIIKVEIFFMNILLKLVFGRILWLLVSSKIVNFQQPKEAETMKGAAPHAVIQIS